MGNAINEIDIIHTTRREDEDCSCAEDRACAEKNMAIPSIEALLIISIFSQYCDKPLESRNSSVSMNNATAQSAGIPSSQLLFTVDCPSLYINCGIKMPSGLV